MTYAAQLAETSFDVDFLKMGYEVHYIYIIYTFAHPLISFLMHPEGLRSYLSPTQYADFS